MAPEPEVHMAFKRLKDELKYVKEIWTRYGWEAKEMLKSWARQNLEPYYEYCASEVDRTKYIDCLRKVALVKNVHRTYRSFWGTV